MQILRSMPQGVDQVIHMLAHHQWFVARNVAELMGDVRMEESVGELGRCLGHDDHRVRRAAAVALAKIGTPATAEPLRRALKDGDAELRIQVASSIGRSSRALAMPLVTLIEAETNADVIREYYAALGRIGSPEAVQALAQAAEPGGRLVGRKSAAQRIAAIEGLRLAGAVRVLETLSNDADKQVKEVARRALEELKRKT
jgi:HEAT repeat protein